MERWVLYENNGSWIAHQKLMMYCMVYKPCENIQVFFKKKNQAVSKRELKCGRDSAKEGSLLLALWMEGAMGQGTKNSHWS